MELKKYLLNIIISVLRIHKNDKEENSIFVSLTKCLHDITTVQLIVNLHGLFAQTHDSTNSADEQGFLVCDLVASSWSSCWQGGQLHPLCGPQIPSQQVQLSTRNPQ